MYIAEEKQNLLAHTQSSIEMDRYAAILLSEITDKAYLYTLCCLQQQFDKWLANRKAFSFCNIRMKFST